MGKYHRMVKMHILKGRKHYRAYRHVVHGKKRVVRGLHKVLVYKNRWLKWSMKLRKMPKKGKAYLRMRLRVNRYRMMWRRRIHHVRRARKVMKKRFHKAKQIKKKSHIVKKIGGLSIKMRLIRINLGHIHRYRLLWRRAKTHALKIMWMKRMAFLRRKVAGYRAWVHSRMTSIKTIKLPSVGHHHKFIATLTTPPGPIVRTISVIRAR